MQPTGRGLRWAIVALSTATVLVTSAAVAALTTRPSPAPASLEPTTLPAPTVPMLAATPPPAAPPAEPTRCAAEPPLDLPWNHVPGEDLGRMFRTDPKKLGSASIGSPTNGSLFNGVPITASEGIQPAGDHPYGTASVIVSIKRAVREVRRCHAGTPKLSVGDISREHGGWLRPHRSHQSGLDADLGYYYTTGQAWFLPAVEGNLDVARTWTLVRALIEGGNVEYVFMDRSVQKLVLAHVQTLPFDRDRIPEMFEGFGNKLAPIRHTPGHQTHFHVRFRDDQAVNLGARIKGLVAPKNAVAQKRKAGKPAGKKPIYPRPVGPA